MKKNFCDWCEIPIDHQIEHRYKPKTEEGESGWDLCNSCALDLEGAVEAIRKKCSGEA